jgi:DNA repair exonuclease SbcCD ATPase subunit
MNQPSVAQVDQLARRSKELDAREIYLATREELAIDVETAVTKDQQELALLDTTIVAREVILKGQQAQMTKLEADYSRRFKELQASTEKETQKYLDLQVKLDSGKQELVTVKTSIADRETYYKNQEVLIVNQSHEGNIHLKGLDYAVTEAKQVIKDLEVKRHNLKDQTKDLETDLQAARDSFAPEVAEHESAITRIDARTQLVTAELAKVETEYNNRVNQLNALLQRAQQVTTETDEKLKMLDVKEREIMAKREALRVEREEMEEAKHYYTSPKSIYEI